MDVVKKGVFGGRVHPSIVPPGQPHVSLAAQSNHLLRVVFFADLLVGCALGFFAAFATCLAFGLTGGARSGLLCSLTILLTSGFATTRGAGSATFSIAGLA